MKKELHIVSFNVPYPANYGGVIDVYYRLQSLHALGVGIHLHCFTYGRAEAPELEQWCESVTYYRRHTNLFCALGRRPYIVQSRVDKRLTADLRGVDAPILLEGLHCCSLLEALPGKRILVRAHNVEHDYYERLARSERNLLRRCYLKMDSRKLRRYEPVLLRASAVLAVTEADASHFRALGCERVLLMPSSHPDMSVVSCTGLGDYAFYHADLSVAENIWAVNYLLDNVFDGSKHRLVVAGRRPDPQLRQRLAATPNASLIVEPDEAEMQRLVREAQVNILVTNQPTGLKLKLLNSLFAGRHCLVNSQMVAGTELGNVCTVADSAEAQREALDRLMQTPFTDEEIAVRKRLLGERYSNAANARILFEEI